MNSLHSLPLGRAALATLAALVATLVLSGLTDKPGNDNDPLFAEAMNVGGVACAGALLVIAVLAVVRRARA